MSEQIYVKYTDQQIQINQFIKILELNNANTYISKNIY